MQFETMTAEIRPRSDWEAVDLGLAMVRRDFWRCLAVWWLAVGLPTVAAGWWLWDRPVWWLILFWWWKPAGSRLVLFELSRRLFGERPAWRASLREIPRAWRRRFFYRFGWARLSPWLPVTLAVEDLEGLRGAAYRQRSDQVTRRGQSAAMWIYLLGDLAAVWFGLALLVLVTLLIPEGQDGPWRMAIASWDPGDAGAMPLLLLRTGAICMMLAMSLADLFVTGAGFGIYLNNRTWIEGWDVELAFKRLARRLSKSALLGLAMVGILWLAPGNAWAAAERDPVRAIGEVKAHGDFKVHTVMDKLPIDDKSANWNWLEWFKIGEAPGWLGQALSFTVIALLAGGLLWLLWKNRGTMWLRAGEGESAEAGPAVRVVMGMEVCPESLPEDVPAAVRALWQQGRPQEALGLLYRAAISRAMQTARVEIQESDTEGECLRRIDQAGPAAHPAYFRGLTGIWMALAYAGQHPDDGQVEDLCQQWPFGERSGR